MTIRRLGFDVPNAAARTLKYHGAFLDQATLGDATTAWKAMYDHLDEAEATMRTAFAMRTEQTNQ
jgi:hypothetical protein